MTLERRWANLLAIVCLAVLAGVALSQTVSEDQNLFMPGTQPGSITFESVSNCDNCHGGFDATVEPVHNWRGSMMANAARDPLWIATMTVALQDSNSALGNFNAGDLCIRCHSPGGWLGGRSEPTNTSALTGSDFEGVMCDFCHRMVDPIPALEQRDLGAETTPEGITAAGTTYDADIAMLSTLKLFDGTTPFLDTSSELPTYYGSGSLPDYIEAGSGQFFVDASGPKRGPRLDANPNHPFNYSRFHQSRYFCATCHDVSNPVVGSLAEGAGTPEEQAAASYGHVERTFSEFALSAFGQNGGAQTADKIGVGVAATCQDCHMHNVTGPLCNKNVPVRSDLALHDLTGGNVWMSTILASADQDHASYDQYNYDILSGAKYSAASVDVSGVQSFGQALLDGATRAQQQLEMAADLVLVGQSANSLTLRVVNNTGHKLISGYPEGRRIWLNVVFSDGSGSIGEINPYTPLVMTTDVDGNDVYVSGGDLTKTNDELVWEANMSSTITGEEHTFHFVLATGRYKDNRIPPKGFDIASAPSRLVVPVWNGAENSSYFTSAEYDGGYDEVTVAVPAGATSATVTLYYQTTSKEYMEFLRSEINGTASTLPAEDYIAQTDTFFSGLKDWGEAMWDLWVHNGGSAPISMVSLDVEICGAGNVAPTLGNYANTTLVEGGSTTVTPTAAPSDTDGTVSASVEASAGFTGTLNVSSATGVVSIGSANAGTYTITVTATDDCGATATKTFTLTVQSPPSITAGGAVARTAGSAGTTATVATVSDLEDDDGTLSVTATTVPSGLTVTNITNTNGTVTATVTAACSATPGANTVVLKVTDSDGLTATANLTVNVTSNPNPTLGSYGDASVAPGGSTTVTPSAAPSDNGTATLSVESSSGYTGTLSVSSATGVVSIGNANTGTYTITVTATDNCGATATKTFALTVQSPPVITAGSALARTAGSAGTTATIATVSDAEDDDGTLSVTATTVPSGLSVTNISNTNGTVTATVTATCSATPGANTLVLEVTDSDGLTATANLTVNVTSNASPTLGNYANETVVDGGSTTVTPTEAPADADGTVTVTVEVSAGYTGTLGVSSATGVVSIGSANAGTYTITVTATDNCDATSKKTFTLTVQSPPVIAAGGAVARTAGSGGTTATIATVSDAEDGNGTLTVTAKTVPSGLTVTNITNTSGTVTATVAAACDATPGQNTVELEVTDSDGLTATASLTVNVTSNPSPTLGSYGDASIVDGGSTTVTPGAVPLDNGTVSLTVEASAGYTGTLGVSSGTGVVSIGNANAGTYTITVTATDNCDATSTKTFTLTVQSPPVIAAGGAVARTAGSDGTTATVATVSDTEDGNGTLTVTAKTVPSGLTVTNITNTNGTVTATVAAACDATPGANTVGLEVTDSDGLTATANLTVNVTSNPSPTLGNYGDASIVDGGSTTVTPSATPSDNGTVSLTVEASAGYTGTLGASSETGEVSIGSVNAGTYTITVTVTDDCGATATKTFTLMVLSPPSIVAGSPVARTAGSGGSTATIATVSDAEDGNGTLTVTAKSVPSGLTVTSITNTGGTVTAMVTATCAATPGVNSVVLEVTDSDGLTATANLTVSVTGNPQPVLGNYPDTSLSVGGATTVTPSAVPSDNGTVTVTVGASPGFSGTLSVSSSTGVVSIANANEGTFGITVNATDNCGAAASQTFTLTVTGSATTPARAARHLGDFDGNGKADVLWRNESTGENATWLMDGPVVVSGAVLPTVSDLNLEVVSLGDLDGDGSSDIVWRNRADGTNAVWLMDGVSIKQGAFLPTIADPELRIVGTGDFDGDGKDDILWRRSSDGTVAVWLMAGSAIKLGALLPSVATPMEIAGTGDVNGDGKADVIWRNTSTGDNAVWLMNGAVLAGGAYLPTVSDPDMEIVGVGDLDGDGKADIVWRNATSGTDAVWLMNGTTIRQGAFLPAIVDQGLRIVSTGDLDGDGKDDILWRRSSDGTNAVWLMNGMTIKQGALLPDVAPPMEIN